MPVSSIEELKPVYLIHGKDEFLLERALRRLRSMFEAVDPAAMDIDVFQGAEASGDAVVAAANTLPFMSPRRLVIVRGIEAMPVEQHPPLIEYVASPARHACLVLVGGLARNTRLYKALEAAGAVAEYSAPDRRKLGVWVAKAAAEKGVRIEPAAADALVAAAGSDLRSLDAELEKLVAYCGERATITVEDVESVVKAGVPAIWSFLDVLGARDVQGAVAALHALLVSGQHPLALFAASIKRIRQLVSAKALVERGQGAGGIARELGVSEWQAKKVIRQASRFEEAELIDALRAGAQAEADMKTSHGDAGLVLERWVLGVCGVRTPARGR